MSETSGFISIGVLGAGGFSYFSVNAFLKVPGIKISGIFDIKPQHSRSFSKKFGCRVFDTQDELLRDTETDIVYIATPHTFHFELAMMCFRHGKHVLVEKPMGMNAHEVDAMINEAKSRNLFLCRLEQCPMLMRCK